MYAIIQTGGKQYRVEEGQRLDVEKLDVEPGAEVVLEDVLLVGEGADVKVGTPKVADARVRATVLNHFRGPKLIVFKKKRRKNYHRKQGHRQEQTALRIDRIEV